MSRYWTCINICRNTTHVGEVDMLMDDIEEQILFSISDGQKSFYDLARKEKIGSNTVVLSALHRLLNKRLIRQGQEEARGKKPYLLTVDGFDIAIRKINRIQDFEGFVSQYKEFFPLVFNYWEQLKNNGLHDWVIFALQNKVNEIDLKIMRELSQGMRTRYSHDEFSQDLYATIYGPFHNPQENENLIQLTSVKKFKTFLTDHPEIKQSVSKRYDEKKKELERKLEYLEEYNGEFLI